MGRTFLDIDMARAADLLGMERRQAETFRDLERGHFVALGPAVSKRPLSVRIGPVETATRSGSPVLVPLPERAPDAPDLIFTPGEGEERLPTRAAAAPRLRPPADDVLVQLAHYRPAPNPAAFDGPELSQEENEKLVDEILREILADTDAECRSIPVLYQDFAVRCRIRRVGGEPLPLPEFRRRLAIARAGVREDTAGTAEWSTALACAAELPDDLQGLFLLVARAALERSPRPSDDALAEAYGTRSPGRVRRLLAYLEERGAIVSRTDPRGRRTLAVPVLGAETAPEDAGALPAAEPLRAPGLRS
jgi:hypothetical protein